MNNLIKMPIRLYFDYMGKSLFRDCYGFSFSPARRIMYVRELNSNGVAVTRAFYVSEITNLEVTFNV